MPVFTPILGDIGLIDLDDAINGAIARYSPKNPNEEDPWSVRSACLFIAEYSESKATQEAYRKELEKLLQWRALKKRCAVTQFTQKDVVEYLNFCKNPPVDWQTQRSEKRFFGQKANPNWRPFSKPRNRVPSNDTRKQGIAIISSFYDYIGIENNRANPVKQIRQKRRFTSQRPTGVVRRITETQVQAIKDYLDDPDRRNQAKYERLRWIFILTVEEYLRISELLDCDSVPPTMGNISRDSNGWWITVVGKGGKERDIPLSDTAIEAMNRYRRFLGLSDFPALNENTPLLPKLRGKTLEPLVSVRQLRDVLKTLFTEVYDLMVQKGMQEQAVELSTATPHWLRHTGISLDITRRPQEHVRDDAGHGSFNTTERYIRSDRAERSKSK